MKWELATNNQLWVILSNDWDISHEHLEGLVNEALKRGLFDNLIKHLINKMFPRWSRERRFNYYDLFSIGYVGITISLNSFKTGKSSFKTFAYKGIQGEFNHYLEKINLERRKVYDGITSLNVKRYYDGNEETFLDTLIDDTQDPEKVVLNKLFWQEEFKKVSALEKEILIMFSEGYSMHEIAQIKGYKGAAFISRLFQRGIQKINPGREFNLRFSGLMKRSKGA